jgi:outer membrane lipoprotein SlyB
MNNIAIVGLLALIIGGGAGYLIATANAPQAPTAHVDSDMSMEEMMDVMNAELVGKEGDDFDREMALQHAGHSEIKNMAEAIITAQESEIRQMREWLDAWYGEQRPVTSGDNVEPGSVVHDVHDI